MQLSNSQISSIQNFFSTKPVKKVYLFGSYARNEADEESDIDLLVELDYTKKIGLSFIGMKLDLQELFSQKIDMITTEGVSNLLKPYIESDKKMIYEKG